MSQSWQWMSETPTYKLQLQKIILSYVNLSLDYRTLARRPGYTKSSEHIVFDVRMRFQRKAWWVKDGHITPDTDTSSYAGVVSRESIRILLTHAALQGVPVMAADVRKAYLQAPTSEKHFFHMWTWVWNREHWQEGNHHPIPLWRKGCRKRLLASPAKLYEFSWVWVLTSWSRCLDERICPKIWIH